MSSITTIKQDGFINSKKVSNWKVKVYGVGSIGSNLIKQLALLGFNDITGFDFDTVEAENIGSQEFRNEHVGMKKTEAIQKLMKGDFDFDIAIVDGKINEKTEIFPEENTIYFCGFDSLEARNMLWDKLKGYPIVWGESRIGQDNQRYYFVDLRNPDEKWIKEYEKSLDPKGPRTELLCGEKGCYSSNSELVGKICKQIVNIAEGKPHKQMYIGAWGGGMSIYREPKVEVPIEITYA